MIDDGTDNGHYDIAFGSVNLSGSPGFTRRRCRGRLHDDQQFPGNRDSFSGTGIWFTGYGYNGQIGALSSFRIPGISFGRNTVEITLTPQ